MNKIIRVCFLSGRGIRVSGTLIILLIIVSICGCAGNKYRTTGKVTFSITPDKEMNNAQPVYLVIRDVTRQSFLIEGYDAIAGLVYNDSPDKSLLAWHVVLPGVKDEITVETAAKSDIGIYAMFTRPEEDWKVMIERPIEPEYEIIIQENTLKYKKKKVGFWKRILGLF